MTTNTYDASYFEDLDELDQLIEDRRSQDWITVSGQEDAIALIEEFRTRETDSPWYYLDRQEIADRLQQLVENSRAITQGNLNLCGPAALICMWNGRDPLGFATFATDLYDTGTGYIGRLEVTPNSDLVEADFSKFSDRANTWAADWMVLGALRNSPDVWWQPSWKGDPGQELAGLTRPEELAAWLEATGIYETVENEANWVEEKGVPHALNLVQQDGRDIALLLHINLINYAKGGAIDESLILSSFPNHFVVLISDVYLNPQQTHVNLSLWTWGDTNRMLSVPIRAFVKNYYGAVIATLPSQD
ncbi:MAG: hypothetical protein KME47_25980 [Nodosilinea sp. WJT8-NPBG4]|jgi:hypothetical protein|nr:hypothetical protein [Nodosilinea sp. WJT8-NPBG4]